MKDKTISAIGERKLIKILLDKRDSYLDEVDDAVFDSYRDDAAIQENKSGYSIFSSDMLIEHTHFPKGMSPYNMGEKIVTVNVSDIIACNATCESILISMALPPDMLLSDYELLLDGILDKCREYEIRLIGGDLNENSEVILSGFVTGHVDDDVKLQTNIRNNNLVAVTGDLGSPAGGFDLLNNPLDINREDKELLINSLFRPNLPMNTSKLLKQYPGMINAMTDITDGLAIELYNLKEKNKSIGFEIFFDKLPYNKSLEDIAKNNEKDIIEYLLHFGEEFELLLILDEEEYHKNSDLFKDIHIIGKVNNSNCISLIRDNKKEIIKIKGYEHLRG